VVRGSRRPENTLALLLRMLPEEGTLFNVFQFDSTVDSLWQTSLSYNETTLTIATDYVESIHDRGGTEIRQALHAVFSSRTTALPTAVFVLTDGQATDIAGTISDIQNAVQSTPSNSPLRVFCLGIGNGVSSAMCEGIARAGNGVCLFAVHTESILGKCARLFRAGRTPFVRNVTVDWGIPDDLLNPGTPSVNFSTPDLRRVRLRPPPIVQQSPVDIHEMHSGTRMNVFVILRLKTPHTPKAVVLRGELDGDGQTFEMTVPIRAVQLTDSEPGVPLVHTLAAWRLIQDHEEKRAPLPEAFRAATDEELRKAAIIRLGERYQLASKYTSFIAVDSRGRDIRDTQNQRTSRRSLSPVSASDQGADSQATTGSAAGLTFQGLVSQIYSSMPGAWRWSATETLSRTPSPTVESQSDVHDEGYDSAETFSTLSSLEGSSDWSDWSDDPPPLSEEDKQMLRSPSPRLVQGNVRSSRVPTQEQTDAPAPPEVVRLARLQSFDGSFSLDDNLRQLVGEEAVNKGSELQIDEKVWATVLFLAFMRKHMGDQEELLDDLCVKAREFLAGQRDAQRLMQEALDIVK